MTGLRNLGIDDETPTPRNRNLLVSASSIHDEKTASMKVSDALLQSIRAEYQHSEVTEPARSSRRATTPLTKPLSPNGLPSLVSDESVVVVAAACSLERTAVMHDTIARRTREAAVAAQRRAASAANVSIGVGIAALELPHGAYPPIPVTFMPESDESAREIPMKTGGRTGIAIALGILAAAAIGVGFAVLQLHGFV
jgi:hypothetical protein